MAIIIVLHMLLMFYSRCLIDLQKFIDLLL